MSNRFRGASSGPYPHRAEILLAALQPLMAAAFGPRLSFKKRDSGDRLQYIWTLPERVTVTIEKSSGADAQVEVSRPDPRGDGFPDFKVWFCTRSTFDSTYDLQEIVNHTRAAIEYNRQKREEATNTEAAIANELAGLELPEGVKLDRDTKSGLYKITVAMEVTNLKPDSVRRLSDSLKVLKEEMRVSSSDQPTG